MPNHRSCHGCNDVVSSEGALLSFARCDVLQPALPRQACIMQVDIVTQRFPAAEALSSKPLDGLKVGVIQECLDEGISEAVQTTADATMKHLESLGAVVDTASLPKFSAGLPAYYIICTSEASSNLSRWGAQLQTLACMLCTCGSVRACSAHVCSLHVALCMHQALWAAGSELLVAADMTGCGMATEPRQRPWLGCTR
jgi:hypothetical protein